MVKVHGGVFLALGVLFSGLSFFVNSAQNTNSLTIFIYIGYLFMAYGIAKLLVQYVLKPKQNNSARIKRPQAYQAAQQQLGGQPVQHNHTQQRAVHNTPLPPGYIGRCSKCGTPMRQMNIYCHRCGQKQ